MAPRSLVVTTSLVLLAAIGAGAWWGTTKVLDVASGRAAEQARAQEDAPDGGAEAPVGADPTAPAATTPDGSPPPTTPDGAPAPVDPATTAPTPAERQTLTGIEIALAESLVPSDLPQMADGRTYRMRPEPEVPRQQEVPASPAPPPVVSAERAVVMDARTGAMLWGKEDDLAVSAASTFKMLTALVALRWSDATEAVPVGEKAVERTGAANDRRIGLVEGEQVPVRDLLGATLVGSANDAAIALGDFVSGGDQGRYNDAAQKLASRFGTRETTVRNATGLDQSGQFSTAYDLAVIARAGLADPLFRELVQSTSFRLGAAPAEQDPASESSTSGPTSTTRASGSTTTTRNGTSTSERSLENRNPLLGSYEGAIGVKTGSTALAGDCLVAAATRDGRTYIVVALKSEDPGADAETMLDWAFDNWATVEVAQRRTEVIGTDGTKGIPAAPLAVSVPAGTQSEVRTYVTAESIEADYRGEVLSSVPRVRAAR